MRSELKKPFGRVMECSDAVSLLKKEKRRIFSIGDSVSEALIRGGVSPAMIVWDGRTKRAPLCEEHLSVLRAYAKALRVKNPPATLKKEAWSAVVGAMGSAKASVFVDGEEDLLAIPAILNANDGDVVIYGLPEEGAILIVIDRKIKALFQDILSRFQ